jgi:uncharacterized protein (DUF1697 family)
MPRYVAFLRGMNLGGRRITNAELGERFTDIGLLDVCVFRASGNVIFLSDAQAESELQSRIEAGLAASLGYGVPTFLRSAEEVAQIAGDEPFSAEQLDAGIGKIQVALLASMPPKKARDALLELSCADDLLCFGERVLYWLPCGPMSQSELNWKAVEKLVGPTTLRTMGTIREIAAKHLDG